MTGDRRRRTDDGEKAPWREKSIGRGLAHQPSADFLRNFQTQFRILFKNSGNIRQVLLPFAPPSFRVQGGPNLSLQHVFHTGDRAVAEIKTRGRQAGVSALSFEAAILSTPQAEVIPFTAQAGGIGVNPSGQVSYVIAITGQTEPSQSTGYGGLLALVGLSILAFSISLGIFIYILRRRR